MDTGASAMAVSIVVPPQTIDLSLGTRSKMGMLMDHHPIVAVVAMASVCCAMDCDACTAGGVFLVYAPCGELLGWVQRNTL